MLNHSHSESTQLWSSLFGPPPAYLSNQTQTTDHFDLFRTDLNWARKWQDGSKLSLYLDLRGETLDTDSERNTFSTIHNRSSVLSPRMQL